LPAVLLARDHPDAALGARARRDGLTRVARGAYLPGDGPRGPREAALARIVAVHHRLTSPHWFSHGSAALVHGLRTWQAPGLTHLRTAAKGGTRRDPQVHRHLGPVPAELTAQVNGLPVTTLALTAADCARPLPARDALVVLDAALAAGAERDLVGALLVAGGPGVRRARTVLRYADPGAESPQETATRLVLLRAGLPVPTTQVRVSTALGTFWADLGIPQWRLLIEYDGRAKYATPDDLYAEKRRQDAITAAGYAMVRVTSLTPPQTLIAQAMAHAPADFRPLPRPELNF